MLGIDGDIYGDEPNLRDARHSQTFQIGLSTVCSTKKNEGSTPLEETPTAGEEKTCEICYDEVPDLALPCGVVIALT